MLRVAIYGTGNTAAALARSAQRNDFTVVAAIAHSEAKVGQDLAAFSGGPATGVITSDDLDAVLIEEKVDVVLYAGMGGDVLVDVMRRGFERGVDVVYATFIHPATALGARLATELDAMARQHGARGLGTGTNPGLWLDVLPALLAGAVDDPLVLTARRTSDIRHWGADVLATEVGVGSTGASDGDHFSSTLIESLHVLAEALGLQVETVERGGGAIHAEVPTTCGPIAVPVGGVIGFERWVATEVAGRAKLELRWVAVADPTARGLQPGTDVRIAGPGGDDITLTVRAPSDPYPATAARMVKSIMPLRQLPPGLHTPAAL
jgi:4-hydroxy-tetrahydrodipicolinate reductase